MKILLILIICLSRTNLLFLNCTILLFNIVCTNLFSLLTSSFELYSYQETPNRHNIKIVARILFNTLTHKINNILYYNN